ncbi:thioesterase domain-containing protein [Nocardia asteroides]|uniref:thioesterase domain-containing protein n=1 Tax=Nocardia asteroides TaxID=1824 RepID=UPI0036602856
MSNPADPAATAACAWSPDRPDACPAVPVRVDEYGDAAALSVVLPIRPRGPRVTGAPLFCLPGEAALAWNFAGLVACVDPDVPVYGLQAGESVPRSVRAYAGDLVTEIHRIAPEGPYQLLGWSAGGFVAHEIAALLRAAGAEVSVVLLDSDPATCDVTPPARPTVGEFVAGLGVEVATPDLSAAAAAAVLGTALAGTVHLTGADLDRLVDAAGAATTMLSGHRPSVLPGDLTVCLAGRGPGRTERPDPAAVVRGWRPYVEGTVTGVVLDGTPAELTAPDLLPELARVLAAAAPAVRR